MILWIQITTTAETISVGEYAKEAEYMTIRRKAFTLIELLIVIVVIAILAAMMMLSSMEANSTAEAARVISDLNTIKRAALMYFVDHPDTFLNAPFLCDSLSNLVNIDDVMRYVDNGKEALAYGADKYKVVFECNKKEPIWYLHYELPQYIKDNPRAMEKLKLKARSHNLLCTGTFNYIPKEDEYYGGTRDSSKLDAMIYFRILP